MILDYADGSGVIAGVFVRKRQRIRGTEGDVVTKERETRRCCVTGLEGARRGPRPRTTSWKREETDYPRAFIRKTLPNPSDTLKQPCKTRFEFLTFRALREKKVILSLSMCSNLLQQQ